MGDPEHLRHELENLTRIVGRDLQRPLQSLSQSCQAMREQYKEFFDPKMRSTIDNALEALDDVQRLVEILLAESRDP
jgi:light-regulated signal transduction histidine kinase (bacteriophytochrome)